MKPSEFINEAADELEKGWTRNKIEDSLGNVCAVGELQRVAERHMPKTLGEFTAFAAVAQEAGEQLRAKVRELDRHSASITGYNDTRSDKSEVITLFQKAAIGLEEQGK